MSKSSFTRTNPCPVCGGYDGMPRHEGIRDGGFLSSDGLYGHCMREEFAGSLPVEKGGTYAHFLGGLCHCGVDHRVSPDTVRSELRSRSNGSTKREERVVAEYLYRDRWGNAILRKLRLEPKSFRLEHRDGSEWMRCHNCQHSFPLYRFPELLSADASKPVYVVESEKTADRMAGENITVTTTGGANSWRPHHSDQFPEGRDIRILRDNDPSGAAYAETVARALYPKAKAIRAVLLPDLPPNGDPWDFLDAGGSAQQMEEIAGATLVWSPDNGRFTNEGDGVRTSHAVPPWPEPLDPAAFHGLAGEIVRTIEPHTEADPTGILFIGLAMFGSMIGAVPFYQVESSHHHSNLFVTLVGKTSRSRKGTAVDRAHAVAGPADSSWSTNRVLTGLSSGEGLIHAVRDPSPPSVENDKGDSGISDKRLLVRESEFASVFQKMKREGNVLSAVLRDAWDGRPLATMTKRNSERATGAHVSVIGEITRDELLHVFDSVQAANGLGNRITWVCVKRTKELPHGGSLDDQVLMRLSRRLCDAASVAQTIGRVRFDDVAHELWPEVYRELTREEPGMFGALTARAEAQVVRLALIYALLDSSAVITEAHLRAALAAWKYAEDSVLYIWGDSLGDPAADTIQNALRASDEGLSRTDINNLLQRNASAAQIERALSLLKAYGRARMEKTRTDGRGRPEERWFALSS